MVVDWKVESQRFDAVAGWYDEYRPSYPPELIETIVSQTRLPQEGKILEVGSGTGKATELFAGRGYSIHCIEPGANLMGIAIRKFKEDSRITFELARFEDWPVEKSQFDLVFSAQAWHWVPAKVGYAKAAAALKTSRFLALFWNMCPDPAGPVFEDLDAVYRRLAPSMIKIPGSYQDLALQREHEISESGFYSGVKTWKFPWSLHYSESQYLGLLNTYSDHLALPEKTRSALFDDVAQTIRRHGGSVLKPYQAVLYLAEKTI